MNIDGRLIIGSDSRCSSEIFSARDAATGQELTPPFAVASPADVSDASAAAAAAQPAYASRSLSDRSAFLRACADRIDALGDQLTKRAIAETGLPETRLIGERGRTVGQLRLFAQEVDSGSWQGLRIDEADPRRVPPKPDLRLRKVPIGPVAIFGASNFPLAFSVAGGDTASALAAGCCIVVKGHPAHPGTSELVAKALLLAAEETGMPPGIISLLHGPSNDVGEALVRNPNIAAVGFTGSREGGLALMRHAAARPVPIPVYAEMSSINPVILMPHRLQSARASLAAAFAASLTMGAGQFCTNPGIVLGIEGAALDAFVSAAGAAVSEIPSQTMLTAGIGAAYKQGTQRLARLPGVRLVGRGPDGLTSCGTAQLFAVNARDFMAESLFAKEVFGPASIVVRCVDMDELINILEGLEGQLTATLHMEEADYEMAARLLPVLERLAGRIIANGWPTGVEVGHAMNHGGPFPATSDGRSTSVGTGAIDRFLRPVAYQDFPDALLPAPLQDGARGILRRVNGNYIL